MSNIHEFTVSEFSRSIKRIIEDNFGYIRLKGEVSGFKKATSGHLYFNLKDDKSLVNAVCFRKQASFVNFDIEDGLELIASGRITTYEGRSNYQIIVEKLEIAGVGAILAAIEERRLRFLKEGYFDKIHKKPLPFLPNSIGIITSPTGAVIQDIINRIKARFPTNLQVYPAIMQGKSSSLEVMKGLEFFNDLEKTPDIIIIARGGGSFEDLLPFNDEELIKSVFKSKIPVISAIGHETDTTLIDYVSDIRAATPSAAAEIAVPVLTDLKSLSENLGNRLSKYYQSLISSKQKNLIVLGNSLIHPKVKLANLEQKFIYLSELIRKSIYQNLKNKEQNLKSLNNQITKPERFYDNLQRQIKFAEDKLNYHCQSFLRNNQIKITNFSKLMQSYDYKNVLARGYSVVRLDHKIISSKKDALNNKKINIEVKDGNFDAKIS